MTVYQADWICPVSSPPIRDGGLTVDGGRIVSVNAAAANTAEHTTFPGCAIIPGFVNVHSHLELTILRGLLEDLPFATWISRLTRIKYDQLSRDDMLVSARLGAIEMLRAGVTCLGEVMDLATGWQAMREYGFRGIAYQETFGPAESQAEESMAALKKKIEAYRRDETETLRAGVSPHAPYTVSSKLFEEVNRYAKREGLPLTTHVAESEDEGMFVRWGAGPFAERLSARGIDFTPAGCSPLEYMDRLDLLRPETLIVHAIDLEDSDFEILRQKHPSLAHCPKSNVKLAHGIARIPEIRQTGIVIGLGTDGMASNNSADMFEEMRAAIFQQRGSARTLDALNAQTVFRMATLGGAECLGLSKHVGSLEAGKCADFVVIDLNDPAVQPVYDPIETMVYSASRANVRATFIHGREIKVDATEILRDAASIAQRLKM